MKILTIGAAMRDLFLEYKNPESMTFDIEGFEISYIMLEEGKKIELDAIPHATGGGGTNAACSFSKQGFDVSSFFKVGNDPQGDEIIKALRGQNIDTACAVRSEGAPTGQSFIVPASSGNNVILVYRGANLTIKEHELPQEAIASCDQLYVTSLSKQSSKLLPIITSIAKQHKKSVAVNPGTSQLTVNVQTLEESLPTIDILIMNRFESSLLMEQLNTLHEAPPKKVREEELPDLLAAPIVQGTICFTLRAYFQEVLKRGPKIIIVTNGSDGVYASDGNQIYYHQALPGKPISTVGAGDAFGSTFVGQLLQEKSIEDALRAGIINSADVIQHLDAVSGQLTQTELDRRVKELDQGLLQTFKQ